jgi:hypothetical protein
VSFIPDALTRRGRHGVAVEPVDLARHDSAPDTSAGAILD